MKPPLSLIIPTYKRAPVLAQTLDHLEAQTIAKDLEVIVVSDGHDDETATLFKNRTWKIALQFLETEKSQQGAVRNRGVDRASAPLILFIGDDIFLQPDACEKHLQAHQRSKPEDPNTEVRSPKSEVAVLGFTTWDPSVGITPVMQWLEESGWQFGYGSIELYRGRSIPKEIQHRYTYASHLSLPTEIAKKIRFREDLALYGWEDVEWGMRLRDAGIELIYLPEAKALHHHRISLEASLERMRTLGVSLVEMNKAVPAFGMLPTGWKRMAYELSAKLPTMAGRHRKAFLEGINEKTNPR